MVPAVRPSLAVLISVLLLCTPVLAYDTPLSDQAVREAYFLGQRRDESMARFLNRYTKFLPEPASGPYISSVSFLTPYALLVKYSSRQSNYSAQQAAIDHKTQDEVVEISIEILLTQSYGAYLTVPTSSRSGSLLISGARLSFASSMATKRSVPMTSRANLLTAVSTKGDVCSPVRLFTLSFLQLRLPPTPPRLKSRLPKAMPSPSISICPPSARC